MKNNLSTKKPNFIYSIASVALVLLLLGFFGMVLLHTNSLVQYLKEQVNIIVELKDDIAADNIAKVKDKLKKTTYVLPNTIHFISKEDALDLLREDFGEDFMQFDLSNPLYNVLTFNVKADFLTKDRLEEIRQIITKDESVRDVFYQEGLVEIVSSNINQLAWIGLGIGVLFLFIALYLIHNTIRLAIYTNRFIIKNMELIGADWNFIARPYLMNSLRDGAISALIAIASLLLIWNFLKVSYPDLQLIQDNTNIFLLCLILLMAGIVLTSLSTYFVVHKFLKMRLDDLY